MPFQNLWRVVLVCLLLRERKESEVTQTCLTLCNPMDCSLPGSSVYGIFQARVLEWVAMSFSRGSSRPKDRTWVSHIVGRRFTVWATWTPCKSRTKEGTRLWRLSLGKDWCEDWPLCSPPPGEVCPREAMSSPGLNSLEDLIVKRKVIPEVSPSF